MKAGACGLGMTRKFLFVAKWGAVERGYMAGREGNLIGSRQG